MELGYGNNQYASQGRPTWIKGKTRAAASAKRLMELRQDCRKSKRMAEINVPACPIPIHHTKLMIAKPQPMGMVTPQMPTPFTNRKAMAYNIIMVSKKATPKPRNHP